MDFRLLCNQNSDLNPSFMATQFRSVPASFQGGTTANLLNHHHQPPPYPPTPYPVVQHTPTSFDQHTENTTLV